MRRVPAVLWRSCGWRSSSSITVSWLSTHTWAGDAQPQLETCMDQNHCM